MPSKDRRKHYSPLLLLGYWRKNTPHIQGMRSHLQMASFIFADLRSFLLATPYKENNAYLELGLYKESRVNFQRLSKKKKKKHNKRHLTTASQAICWSCYLILMSEYNTAFFFTAIQPMLHPLSSHNHALLNYRFKR